ncbi:MAG: hypothetical protein IT461_10370 [Planctomycetes bacterium]|jgi:hypothetical protein|nr:hypothetical protein [Planctomycetota bacterium]
MTVDTKYYRDGDWLLARMVYPSRTAVASTAEAETRAKILHEVTKSKYVFIVAGAYDHDFAIMDVLHTAEKLGIPVFVHFESFGPDQEFLCAQKIPQFSRVADLAEFCRQWKVSLQNIAA